MIGKRLRVPRRLVKRRYRPPGRPLELERVEDRLLLAVITVNTTVDENSQSDSTLSLREAIEVSNGTLPINSLSSAEQSQVSGALSSPNTIAFNLASLGFH